MFTKRLCAAALALSLIGCVPIGSFTTEMRGVSNHAAVFINADAAGTVRCQSAALTAIDQAIGASTAALLPKSTASALRATVTSNCEVLNGLVSSNAGGTAGGSMVPAPGGNAGSQGTAGQGCSGAGPCEVGATAATATPSDPTSAK